MKNSVISLREGGREEPGQYGSYETDLSENTVNTAMDSKDDIDAKQIYWLDLPGNKYLKKLEPAMLTTAGCITRQEIRPIGRKRFEDREWVEVLYDKRYVICRLIVDILQPLNIKSVTRLLNLMIDVWTQAEETSNDALTEGDRIRSLLSSDISPVRDTVKTIDLKMLKARRLHGRDAYFADELLIELQNQGFVVTGNQLGLVSKVSGE